MTQADAGGVIAAQDVQRLAREAGVDVRGLMSLLLPRAAELARPPVSNFRVGAVCRGISTGNLYFGTNVEFAETALSTTVHAEQSAVTNAWMSGEEGIDAIAVTAAPCGYCRQFLNELATADRLEVTIGGEAHPLAFFLPSAFGPRDLGIEGGLMQREDHALALGEDSDDELLRVALEAANRSYAPYSHSYAGVALRAADGTVVSGSYAENAAFNPSMSPLQVALSRLNLRRIAFDTIVAAALVQSEPGLHEAATREVLAAVSDAPLRVARARNAGAPPRR
jgi:cytidine deaminase